MIDLGSEDTKISVSLKNVRVKNQSSAISIWYPEVQASFFSRQLLNRVDRANFTSDPWYFTRLQFASAYPTRPVSKRVSAYQLSITLTSWVARTDPCFASFAFVFPFRLLSTKPSIFCRNLKQEKSETKGKDMSATQNNFVCNTASSDNSIGLCMCGHRGWTSGRHALIDRSEYWRDPRDGLRRWISKGRSAFFASHEIWLFNMLGRYLCTRGIAPDPGISKRSGQVRTVDSVLSIFLLPCFTVLGQDLQRTVHCLPPRSLANDCNNVLGMACWVQRYWFARILCEGNFIF